jgi:hypothetical protein
MQDKFTEDDKKQVVEFLNHVAQKAQFSHNVQESIRFYKLLTFMQNVLLKKIDANIFEVEGVYEDKPQEGEA